jgi:hypothetical protein
MLTQSELKSRLHYNSETGIFTYLKQINNTIKIGDIAGTLKPHGYISISINNKLYYAHRLVWLYVYNKLPENTIDHINGNRCDNSLTNLREASKLENNRNSKINKNNTSGIKGVYYSKRNKNYVAQITLNYKTYYLGSFKNIHDAEALAIKSRKEHFQEFFNPY